jgi:acetyl esterase/lipase
MDLEHIILTGDSAGGHLSVSVALLAQLRGFRAPDSIFAHYPVFETAMKFSPSLLLAIDEWLLSECFLSVVMGCFLRNGGNPDQNCICSPMLAPASMLNKLPRVYMTACEIDVLRDHSFLFL